MRQRIGDSQVCELVTCLLAVLMCAAFLGCRNDMHVQPKVLPLSQSDFFADGRGSRSLPPGTVARGELRDDSYFYTGLIDRKPGNMMPFPVTHEVLQRGQERFNIFCTPCHSRLGDGNGMIVQRGYRRPPSFHDPKLLQAPLGHFYDVISNGFGVMPDYGDQVPPSDRWAIAAYIRALQLSQHAPLSAMPPGHAVPSSSAESPAAPIGGSERQP